MVSQRTRRLLDHSNGQTYEDSTGLVPKPELSVESKFNAWFYQTWLLADGMRRVSGVLPDPKYKNYGEANLDFFYRHLDFFQRQVDAGMLTYAMARGVNEGWLDASFEGGARKGWLALEKKVTVENDIIDVCASTDTGDLEFYMKRPRLRGDLHGFGSFLLAGAEVFRLPGMKGPVLPSVQ